MFRTVLRRLGHDLSGGAGMHDAAMLGDGHVADPMDNVLRCSSGRAARRFSLPGRERGRTVMLAYCVDDLPGAFSRSLSMNSCTVDLESISLA